MPKFMFLLATQKGFDVLSHILNEKQKDIIGCVITFKEMSALDYEGDIKRLCIQSEIPHYHYVECNTTTIMETLVKKHNVTIMMAIGWRYLLPISLNEMLEKPIMVFHDSLLPKYRGFAPTPTAIICGEKVVGVTIFYATSAADKGDIIWQKEISVEEHEYVQQIIDKQSVAYVEGFKFVLEKLISGELLQTFQQDESQATYSIWRSKEDCRINWKRDVEEICNLVRAVSSPYMGAFTYYKDKKIIIHRARVVSDLIFMIRDEGKIWSIIDNCPVVVCGKGMLQILYATYESGQPVVFDSVRCRLY